MKSNVSYEKQMRQKAILEGRGLVTIDINFPSKNPKRLGGRITTQGPATREECDRLSEFLMTVIEARKNSNASAMTETAS